MQIIEQDYTALVLKTNVPMSLLKLIVPRLTGLSSKVVSVRATARRQIFMHSTYPANVDLAVGEMTKTYDRTFRDTAVYIDDIYVTSVSEILLAVDSL